MRLNKNTKIIGNKVILVPYREKHVPNQIRKYKEFKEWSYSNLFKEIFVRTCDQSCQEHFSSDNSQFGTPAILQVDACALSIESLKWVIHYPNIFMDKPCTLSYPYFRYHTWMLSEELRNLTASEPLSLEEEYDMQKSWLLDENKCTFIILDKEIHLDSKDEIASMIGDTNFFFTKLDGKFCAEAEIMIAEVSSRGKKRGWEAMLHMILYGIVFIQVEQFVVKIGGANSSSIKMFQKMGFLQTKPVDIFNEITMERTVDSEWIDWIRSQLTIHEISNYETNFE